MSAQGHKTAIILSVEGGVLNIEIRGSAGDALLVMACQMVIHKIVSGGGQGRSGGFPIRTMSERLRQALEKGE